MTKKVKEEVITYLPFPDCVRLRPNLYIGETENSSVLLREIIDNATDEISVYGDTIYISPEFNGYCAVMDNGRGLPISYSTMPGKESITQCELSISDLHTGSKFSSDNIDDSGNVISRSGLHGLGSSAASALSSVYIILSRITEDNYNKSTPEVLNLWTSSGHRSKSDLYYVLITEKGLKSFEGAMKLKDIEKMIFQGVKGAREIPRGFSTLVFFKPDPTIFESTKAEVPVRNLQYFLTIQEKFYGRKSRIIIDDYELEHAFAPYKYEILKKIVPADTSMNKLVEVYVTFEVDPGLQKSELGSISGLEVNQGVHINYVEAAYEAALRKEYGIKHKYVLNGLKICVVALANSVSYDSQTKVRLKSITKVKSTDFLDLAKDFIKIFRKDRDYWDTHVSKLNYLAESMTNVSAIDKAKKIISSGSGVSMYRSKAALVPGFVDATSPNRMNCTLWICEGLSPGSSLVNARLSPAYDAILPLRGKIMATQDKTLDQVMDNKEIYSIISAIKLGIDAESVIKDCSTPEEAWQAIMKNTRYSKVCIAVDPDPDGYFIGNSLLYMFGRFARFMIDFGLIYLVEVPVFIQTINGVEKFYYPSDPVVEGTILPVGMDLNKKYVHIKGLGSLSKEQVQKAFYNPDTRRLLRVTPENFDRAMELTENIMKRKQFLYECGVLSNPYNFEDVL